MTQTLSWPGPPENWAARLHSSRVPAELHVWAVPLTVRPSTLDRLKPLLTEPELERAHRFRFPVHRDRFIIGRASLRHLLGGYLGANPAGLEFAYGPNGKPLLPASGIDFNLAHSQDLALLAVSATGPVGVDVEAARGLSDAAELVARFFSPRESDVFQRLALSEQPDAFFNLWTRKEALLKATGEGIGQFLNRVEVTFLANEPARFVSLPEVVGAASAWDLHSFSPAPGFTGALATTVRHATLQMWTWDWNSPEGRPDTL